MNEQNQSAELPPSMQRVPLAPHMQRVIDEKRDLDARLLKLNDFIVTNPLLHQCSEAEQERLKAQSAAMALYSNILALRIDAFPTPG